MKPLICYIAFGDATCALARLSMATLAHQGWSGDTAVVTDRTRTWPALSGLKEVVLGEPVINLDPVSRFFGSEIDCRDFSNPGDVAVPVQHLTPIIHRWLELRDYDLVICIDADVVANASPDDCARKLMSLPYDFGVGQNARPLSKTKASKRNLSWLEVQRWRRAPCINSGLFFFKPTRIGMGVMKAWECECARRIAGDQAALQAVLLRQFRKEIAVLDYSYQGFGTVPKRYSGTPADLEKLDSAFVHFRGAIRNQQVMKDYVARFHPEALSLLNEG